MAEKEKNVHAGHRERLKNRFIKEGLDSFQPHEILELLLFYGIQQRDTNETAHLLLDRFGSIRGVFDADINELQKVSGVKENCATLLKLIPKLSSIYALESNSESRVYDSVDKIGQYLIGKYIGVQSENVILILLNNKYEMIDCTTVYEGCVNSANISPRKILELVIRKNAASAVVAHNHPSGLPIPSAEDIDTTAVLINAFRLLEIPLLEHILVAGEKYFPIIKSTPSLKRLNEL